MEDEEEKNKEEEISKKPFNLKLLKSKDFPTKLKKNPWIASTLVLGIFVLILLFAGNFSGIITGKVISKEEAGEMLLNFYESNGVEELSLISVDEVNGFYKINFEYQNNYIPFYVTKTGYIVGNELVSILESSLDNQEQESIDWSVFENGVSFDIKSKILSFTAEEPKEYDSSIGISEFANYELIPKTLIVFYSSGCGWCSKYYPVLVEAMEKYPEITIYALVLSDNRDIAEKYGITGTPANIINGKYIVSGYRSLEDLSEILDKLN